jgi:phospholipid/cholesterol/gamma-HCH transport system substrate-binding protein
LQEIMNSVPSILAALDEIVQRMNHFVSAENAEAFGRLLTSASQIAETLARNRDSMGKGLAGFGDAGQSFAEAGKLLEKLMANAQTLVDKDIRNAAKSVDKASGQLGSMAAGIEPGLARFSRDSVEELHRFLVEARRLMTYLSSLAQKLESDPRRFLLGNPVPEFSVP